MKSNILICGYDYEYCVKVAKQLANFFDMRYFGWRELFEFDHVPMTFEEVLNKNGNEYVEKKLKSICKMESDFLDAVFTVDLALSDVIEPIKDILKENNFIVFLKKDDIHSLHNIRSHYLSEEELKFYGEQLDIIEKRSKIFIDGYADVIVDIDGLSIDQTKDQITKKIIEIAKM